MVSKRAYPCWQYLSFPKTTFMMDPWVEAESHYCCEDCGQVINVRLQSCFNTHRFDHD